MYYVNGHYVDPSSATLPILDLGLLRGCAVFDYLRTYEGNCFHLDEHLQRLEYSATQLGLDLPHSLQEIKEIVLETKRLNPFKEASIKVIITGGISHDQFTPSSQTHLIVLVYPLSSYPAHYFTNGISVITTRLSRSLPKSKTTQYIPGIVALQKGKSTGITEALYLNEKGEILEAITSNFFAFRNGTLYTCNSEEILFGITREVLLQLAQPHYKIQMQSVTLEQIDDMEEAFITASNKEVMPVIQIDGRKVGNGTVGQKTRHLMQLFRAYTEQTQWPPLSIPRHTRSGSTEEALSNLS